MSSQQVFKLFSYILLTIMVVRHWMYYFPLAPIVTEFGYDQPLYGILLIPVTACFGFLFFWGRSEVKITFFGLGRLLIIGAIPVVIATFRGEWLEVFTYTIVDDSRRPTFLILLPIALAVLLSFLMLWLRKLILLMGLGYVLLTDSTMFVLYYCVLFLSFSMLSVGILKYASKNILATLAFSTLMQSILIAVVLYFEVTRIHFLYELVWTGAYMLCFWSLICVLHKPINLKHMANAVSGVNVFNFYFFQAVFFYVFMFIYSRFQIANDLNYLVIFGVLSLSTLASLSATKITKYIAKYKLS